MLRRKSGRIMKYGEIAEHGSGDTPQKSCELCTF